MTLTHGEDVPAQRVENSDRIQVQVLQTGPNFIMRRFSMAPGGGMPKHTNTVEHEQYVLKGQARIGIGDETIEVRAGDVVFIPNGSPHWYLNTGEGDFEFLCIIPNRPDKIQLVENSC
jgi:quercetin dioxygenase-like cupin family protein